MPDIIENARPAPALSATSDAPVLHVERAPVIDLTKPAPSAPVDNGEGSQQSDATVEQADEADAQPKDDKSEEGGEEKDQTSPQQRAAFARERNRRQAAEQRATRLETMLEQTLAAVTKLTGEQAQATEDPRPARSAFDDPDAYDKALESWAGRRAAETARAEAKAEAAKAEQERSAQAVVASYQERQSAFASEHADFEEVVLNEDLQISPAMTEAIVTAEEGPAIAYWLGQNPEEAARIAKLPAVQAVREIGRIEARLSQPTRRAKPAPLSPLRSRNDSGSDAEPDMNAYGERRLAELRQKRAAN